MKKSRSIARNLGITVGILTVSLIISVLQVNMADIRKKFGAKPGEDHYIINEIGVGYRRSSDKR